MNKSQTKKSNYVIVVIVEVFVVAAAAVTMLGITLDFEAPLQESPALLVAGGKSTH